MSFLFLFDLGDQLLDDGGWRVRYRRSVLFFFESDLQGLLGNVHSNPMKEREGTRTFSSENRQTGDAGSLLILRIFTRESACPFSFLSFSFLLFSPARLFYFSRGKTAVEVTITIRCSNAFEAPSISLRTWIGFRPLA